MLWFTVQLMGFQHLICTDKFIWFVKHSSLHLTTTFPITYSFLKDMDTYKNLTRNLTCVYGCYDAELYLKVSLVLVFFLFMPTDIVHALYWKFKEKKMKKKNQKWNYLLISGWNVMVFYDEYSIESMLSHVIPTLISC